MFVAKDGEKSSSFNYGGAILADLSKPFMDCGLMRQMLGESVKSLDTRGIDGKFTGPVIVAPTCEDMVWANLLANFLGDRALIEGTSRWKDSLGQLVADKKLTLRAAPGHPQIVCGAPFTDDGFAAADCDLIKDGVLTSFALSLYGANKTGKPRTANTAFGNMEVLPGDVALADMVKGIDKGILLGRFSGGSPGASGDVSGVAKNSFLIENSQITDALQETMVSFNVLDALKSLSAISKERISDGNTVLPWCRFDGITISGK
jgi:PmbA protein